MKFDKEQIIEAVKDVNVKSYDFDKNLNFKPYYEFSIDDVNENIIPSFYNAQAGIHYNDDEYKRNGVCLAVNGYCNCNDLGVIYNDGIDESIAIEIAKTVADAIYDFEEYIDENLLSCENCHCKKYSFHDNLDEIGFKEINHRILCEECSEII